jgi:hypothetical protein
MRPSRVAMPFGAPFCAFQKTMVWHTSRQKTMRASEHYCRALDGPCASFRSVRPPKFCSGRPARANPICSFMCSRNTRNSDASSPSCPPPARWDGNAGAPLFFWPRHLDLQRFQPDPRPTWPAYPWEYRQVASAENISQTYDVQAIQTTIAAQQGPCPANPCRSAHLPACRRKMALDQGTHPSQSTHWFAAACASNGGANPARDTATSIESTSTTQLDTRLATGENNQTSLASDTPASSSTPFALWDEGATAPTNGTNCNNNG